MFVLILVAFVAVLAAGIYVFLERRYSTWKRKGVPGPPASFSLTLPKVVLGRESVGDVADRIYKEYRDAPMAGTYVYATPVLHLIDPEIIKHVLIKEFQDFNGRADKLDYDPMSNNLFALSGQKWRNLRVKLTPTFTSGKIKYMFETIKQCSQQMVDYIEERVAANGGQHCENARPLMMRLFVDTISSVAFGIESNVVKNADSEFYRAARKAIAPTLSNYTRGMLPLFALEAMRLLRMNSTSSETHDFFTKVVRDSVNYRESNNVDRADLLNLLIQLKNKGFVAADKDANAEDKASAKAAADLVQKLSMDEIMGNVFIFFIAGFESSASTTSFTLYEMAKNPEILEKALREVDQVMADHDGNITYDTVVNMPYLDKCVSETLRKYPPLPFVTRMVTRTRKVPLSDVEVEKGTKVLIPIRALHYDPVYWPDPERYDPERFSEEQKRLRPAQAYLPFGDGPRICIAARLGVTQIKTALVMLLSKYTVSAALAEPKKVKINPKSFATTPQGELNVTFLPRKPASDIVKRRPSTVAG